MNTNNGITDPVNHKLRANELQLDQYSEFLEKLTDVPSSVPLRNFSIDRAGITNQSACIKIRSLFSDSFVSVLCTITMHVELHGHRGIHMSRCEEALFYLAEQDHESLDEFAEKLAKELQSRQEADVAYVSVEACYLAERTTVKTQRSSHDKMILYVDTKAEGEKVTSRIGLAAFNMTGCPCTETFTKFSVVPQLIDKGFTLEQIRTVLDITNSGTHTQRGLAKLVVDKADAHITHRALYDILDQSCHLVFELLKRPDEHELVLRALKKPQFTEDVVREITAVCLKDFENYLDKKSRIFASSLLFDSIHIHDVHTEIDKTYGELDAEK